MKNKLLNFIDYSLEFGMSKAVSLGFQSLHYRFQYKKTFHFLENHLSESPDIYNYIRDWKDFLTLKEQYSGFMRNLPHYRLTSSGKTKVIWWCWLQGEEQAPRLCKVCLQSLRKQFPDYNIRIVTEDNMLELVHLPRYIIEKYRNGIISRTHFSDILRTCLLIEHGGVWIDSTVLCTGYNEPVFDYPLFVFQDWKFNRQQPTVASSWFISAWKEEPILCEVRDLLFEYWKRNDRLINYFVFHLFFHMATENYKAEWDKVPRFSNIPPHLLQFELFDKYSDERYRQICRGSDFHKLTYKHRLMPDGKEGSFYNKLFLGE